MAWISTQDKKSGPRYRVFWKDSEGKQHGKVFRKYEKAKTFKREIEHSLEVGTYINPARGRIRLGELCKDFLDAPPVPLAPTTRALYETQIRRHILPKLGAIRINSIQPQHVRKFMAELEAEGVGPASINSTFRTLRRLLQFALRDRRIALNPASGLKAPKSKAREMQCLRPEQVDTLVRRSLPVTRRSSTCWLIQAYGSGKRARFWLGNLT